jgi:voltage-gated potassium channel Kch
MPDDVREADGERLIIVVGGDALALSTAREISTRPGHRVNVLWQGDGEFQQAVESIGGSFIAGRLESRESLERAGVHEAETILALSRDDQLNLQTALRARDANPAIRIVLRQFNRTLAAKIEQNLPNCSVLSLAWYSAATYAAVGLDPSCFRGLQFPEPDGPLTGFALRVSDLAGIAGKTVQQAEDLLGARVVAVNGDTECGEDRRIPSQAQVVVFGPMERLLDSSPRQSAAGALPIRHRMRQLWSHGHFRLHRIVDPILGSFVLAAIMLFVAGIIYFRYAFPTSWLLAAYFVLTTMTTSGYGDMVPDHDHPGQIIAAMVLMAAGISFVGIFIAMIASRLTRAQWVRMQGLRRVRRRGHIVVCGAGSIGSGVIELLLEFDRPLVVVESRPDPAMVERARDEGFDLLTGDASRDETLELCNLRAAHSLVALTNVDTLNLEIALGARARNPTMPIVLRIAEASLGASIARHFDLQTTFSVAALAAPAFASLVRSDGARGRVAFANREFEISEVPVADGRRAVATGAIPLAAMCDGEFRLVRGLDDLEAGDQALLMTPLAAAPARSEQPRARERLRRLVRPPARTR